jgi:hypothetical protein
MQMSSAFSSWSFSTNVLRIPFEVMTNMTLMAIVCGLNLPIMGEENCWLTVIRP